MVDKEIILSSRGLNKQIAFVLKFQVQHLARRTDGKNMGKLVVSISHKLLGKLLIINNNDNNNNNIVIIIIIIGTKRE